MLLTSGSHEVYWSVLLKIWWNDSTGVDQQSFHVTSHDRQIAGDCCKTHTNLQGRLKRLDSSRRRLDAPSGALRPAVDVDSTARAASVDDDRVLVPGRRLATAARLHWVEVQRTSRTDSGCLRECFVIEDHEQLKQQRRTQDNCECWFRERRHRVQITHTHGKTNYEIIIRIIGALYESIVRRLVAPWRSASVSDRCPPACTQNVRCLYELRWIAANSPSVVLLCSHSLTHRGLQSTCAKMILTSTLISIGFVILSPFTVNWKTTFSQLLKQVRLQDNHPNCDKCILLRTVLHFYEAHNTEMVNCDVHLND